MTLYSAGWEELYGQIVATPAVAEKVLLLRDG